MYGSATVVVTNQAQPGIVAACESFLSGSGCQAVCSVYDTDGNPLVPAKLSWRLDDLRSQKTVVPWTALGVPAAVNTVGITSAQNKMISLTDLNEERQVTFQIVDSAGGIYLASAKYVLNQWQSVLPLPAGRGPL